MEYSGELPSCIYIALYALKDNQSSHIFSLATIPAYDHPE